MLTYAVELPLAVTGVVDDSKAQEIGQALQRAYEVERLFGSATSPKGLGVACGQSVS